MTNNTGTNVPSKSSGKHDWVGTVLGFFIVGIILSVGSAIVSSTSSHRGLAASSVAASAASEPRPAVWGVRAQFYGEEVAIDGLKRTHSMRAAIDNLGCPDGQLLRCCHAEVYFDGQLDSVETHVLCAELPAAVAQPRDNQPGAASDALRRYADSPRFDQLYRRHYDHDPNDRDVYVTYDNGH